MRLTIGSGRLTAIEARTEIPPPPSPQLSTTFYGRKGNPWPEDGFLLNLKGNVAKLRKFPLKVGKYLKYLLNLFSL